MNTKEYTFQTLFGAVFEFEEGTQIELTKIEIPRIQRDYAQGRQSSEVKRIRERFLDTLFHAIVENKKLTLDFVYGDVSEKGVLTPLDGQQRLTTLFLLHWYVAKKEPAEIENAEFIKNFTYETRVSSRDFCSELVKYTPDFTEDVLSTAIKDQSWYPYEWKNDPTIQSMLVMIDAIHEKFKNESNLWESLVTNKNITFYFLPLSDMGLTDDLYIKMNSRGKPLTPFEHFKAEFEDVIKKVSGDLSKEINHKFDIEWTDMLFPFRGDNHIIDDEFMRYFHFVSDIIVYKNGMNLERDEFQIAKNLYSKENENAEENIVYFRNALDCWLNMDIEAFFNQYFAKYAYESGKVKLYQDNVNIFKECLDNYGEYSGRNRKFPLNKILLLYSVIIYLQNKESISDKQFQKRIRIIRNLIWNSPDEIRDDRMINLLSESESIILTGEIPEVVSGILAYNESQKEEERTKKTWLETHQEMENELFHLEDHNLLFGCVSIIDLNQTDNFKKFRLLFNNCSKDLINRALLAVGDYSQQISWRVQIGARNNDSVWINLFHPSKQRLRFNTTVEIVNKLLSSLEDVNINNEYLDEFAKQYIDNQNVMKDWKYYLIKYSPMRESNFGMYYWSNRIDELYNVIMMNTAISLGGKNWNIFLYTLNQLPEFAGKLSLGDYSYQGDKIKVKNTDYEIECQNDKYVISKNELQLEYPIQQNDGIDIEDRIERGKEIIKNYLTK
jgi:hypothetical protein